MWVISTQIPLCKCSSPWEGKERRGKVVGTHPGRGGGRIGWPPRSSPKMGRTPSLCLPFRPYLAAQPVSGAAHLPPGEDGEWLQLWAWQKMDVTCSSDSSSLLLLSSLLQLLLLQSTAHVQPCTRCTERVTELKQLLLPASPPCSGSPYLPASTPDPPSAAPKHHSHGTGELGLTWGGISPPASLGEPAVGKVGVSTVISVSSLLG